MLSFFFLRFGFLLPAFAALRLRFSLSFSSFLDVSFSSLNIRFSRYRRDSLSVPMGLSEPFLSCSRFWEVSFYPMGLSGLEPPTSRLSGVRSNRLSYKPFSACFFSPHLFPVDSFSFYFRPLLSFGPMETKRFELSTPCLQGRCSPS